VRIEPGAEAPGPSRAKLGFAAGVI